MSDKIRNISARAFPTFDERGLLQFSKTCVELGVLVEVAPDTYRVYLGIVPDNSLVDRGYAAVRESVVAHGRPASLKEAQLHYPQMSEDRYSP